MKKTIQSTPITFVDQTDSRKLEVYIKSSLPTVQIYNQNTGAYTPSWEEGDGLELNVDLFLDSRILEENAEIKWYKDGTEMQDAPEDSEDISTDKKTVYIKRNVLQNAPIVTYVCESTYQGITASSRITFARVDAGLNGEDGEDGIGVKIRGVAKSVTKVGNTNYYTIEYGEGTAGAEARGDAYVLNFSGHEYDGHLFVCAELNGGDDGTTDYFIKTGPLKGDQGAPAKSISLIGSSQVFKVDKNEDMAPRQITVEAHTTNINDPSQITWEYRYNAIGVWTVITNELVDEAISLSNNIITIDGSELSSNVASVAIKASFEDAEDVLTVYKTFDGADGDKGDPAPIAFLTNENISFIADYNGETTTDQSVITKVVAYVGDQKVRPELGDLDIANAGLSVINMTIEVDDEVTEQSDQEIALKISVPKGVNLGSALSIRDSFSIPVVYPTSAPLSLNWNKINAGAPGVGINYIDVKYGVTSSSDNRPQNESDWEENISDLEIAEGSYLWTRTIINYTDANKADTVTYTYVQQGKQGEKGNTGTSVEEVDITYAIHSNSTTAPTSGWDNSVMATTADKQYLWTRTIFKLSNGTDGDPVYSVSKQGIDGSNLKTFTTEYETSQTNIDNWAKLESREWNVNESTSGVKVGDTVMLRCYNTTKQGHSYIVATVISIPGDKVIHAKSIGSLDKGDSGSPASLVDITPSALYFKSTTGSTGTFTPQYIYLYPRFQNATYQGWQYSRDGGVSWQDVVSGLNWLLIDTFDSVPYSLRIDRGSTLYTDTITSISFRCNSTTQGVYDTISIAKIYDVVDLQIGGRNLLRWTQGLPIASTHNGPDGFSVYSGNIADILTSTDVGLKLTFNSTTGACMSIPLAADGCVENGELYTLSFDYRGNITQPGLLYFLQRTSPNVNINLSSTSSLVANETEWQHYEVTFSSSSLNARINYQILLFYGLSSYTADNWIEIKKESLKLEKGNKKTAWTPAIEDNVGTPGAAGADAVTFQVYSSNGYALSANTPTVTLQTFSYIGDIAIQAGATYQWYQYNNSNWVAISGATNAYLTVSRDDVASSNNYMCKMQFNNVEYVGVATIDDKSDVNKVFTSKPFNYVVGDLWIVGVDYVPVGVEVGTLLKAEHTNSSYEDSDWIAATKYDDKINSLQNNVDTYNQYFSFDTTNGVTISARDASGVPSQFSTSLTNERLSFNYGNESIAYINGTKMNIKEAEIESPLTVTGKYSGSTMLQAPVINIGNFSIIVESNGSLSIVVNS